MKDGHFYFQCVCASHLKLLLFHFNYSKLLNTKTYDQCLRTFKAKHFFTVCFARDYQAAQMARDQGQPDQQIEVSEPNHTLSEHNDDRVGGIVSRMYDSYPCSLCNISLGSASKLKTHMFKHTDERPYSC